MRPDFSKGLVPAVAQAADGGKVLMVAYMDDEPWAKTREKGAGVVSLTREGALGEGSHIGQLHGGR